MADVIQFTPASVLTDASAALNLLTGTTAGDVVAVFDQMTGTQIFPDARPIKDNVRETSRVMDYPVETGVTLSDHHIINPVEIEILFIIPSNAYASAYQQMRTAWVNATKLAVQTRTGVYQNMIIADMAREEDPDMFDAFAISVRLREVIFVVPNSIAAQSQPANYVPANPANQNTVARGFQSSALPLAGSILSYIHAASVWGK